jgi:hypothetical protein
MRIGAGRSVGLIALFLVLGAILGGIIGELITGYPLGGGLLCVGPPLEWLKTYPSFRYAACYNQSVCDQIRRRDFTFHPNLYQSAGQWSGRISWSDGFRRRFVACPKRRISWQLSSRPPHRGGKSAEAGGLRIHDYRQRSGGGYDRGLPPAELAVSPTLC